MLLERDPGLHNKQDSGGCTRTGLMNALCFKEHSVSRWLLSLPGLNTSIYDVDSWTALHYACQYGAPLNIVTTLVRLSTLETVNMKDSGGDTALILALRYRRHSLSRWLLSLPGLDTSIHNEDNITALHIACMYGAPLDIVTTLTRLCTMETVNIKESGGNTALDDAVEFNNTSAALYLSWLGADCKEAYRNCYYNSQGGKRVKHTFTKVTLQTWIEAGCQQEAQYWAVAANDLSALKQLVRMENITLEREKLRRLAKLFNHREVWSYVTSLESLAWEEIRQSSPALVTTPPAELLEKKVPDHTVGIILNCRNEYEGSQQQQQADQEFSSDEEDDDIDMASDDKEEDDENDGVLEIL